MPIRSQNVTAPQDRPSDDELKAPKTDPQPDPAATPLAKDDDKDKGDQATDTEPKAEGPVQSRVIALPRQVETGEWDFFGLEVESYEATDTDYGDVAKFKVRAPKSVLDELEARAQQALAYHRTVNPREG
jgi:hypothetical protein